ncbi:MAG: hypothetical protein V5804_00395 [Mucilaginibacter sp.]|uniref:hypothetical protein n=1 Tax=Mucilaginibacter sp. TaxID=1882438 RepID=UPI0034E5B5BC
MQEQTVENETRMYLFDLMNTAKEHGFKADDNWQLSLATDKERSNIQKNYHPTIAAKMFPEVLLPVFHSIKSKLHQTLNSEEQLINTKSISAEDLKFLVAFVPTRPRT